MLTYGEASLLLVVALIVLGYGATRFAGLAYMIGFLSFVVAFKRYDMDVASYAAILCAGMIVGRHQSIVLFRQIIDKVEKHDAHGTDDTAL